MVSLHIIGSRASGGAERFFARLVTALREEGSASAAVTPPASVILNELGSEVPRFELPMRGIWDLSARFRIAKLVERERPAIVQTWMGRATRLTHLPSRVESVHVARLGGYYNLKGYRHAHAWVGNTRGICDYLIREGLPAERVFHIGNFIEPSAPPNRADSTALRKRLGIDDNAKVVLSVGRLHPNKGFGDLLRAIVEVPETIDGTPVLLVIVGDGPLRAELHRAATELGIEARVHWTGWQDDPGPYYGLADMFVCASRHEPLGNVVLEAWCHGVPVVSTQSEGPLEIITDGENGQLVPCRDPRALGAAITGLLRENDDARDELVRGGRNALAREHSRRSVTAAYADLYERLAR